MKVAKILNWVDQKSLFGQIFHGQNDPPQKMAMSFITIVKRLIHISYSKRTRSMWFTSNWIISKVNMNLVDMIHINKWTSDSHWLTHIDIKARSFYYLLLSYFYLPYETCPLSPLSTGPMGQGRLAIRRSRYESCRYGSECPILLWIMSIWITYATYFNVVQFDIVQVDVNQKMLIWFRRYEFFRCQSKPSFDVFFNMNTGGPFLTQTCLALLA